MRLRLGRNFNNARQSAGYFIGESVLIIVSILIAFLVNEWREDRAEKAAAREALRNFRAEITRNLEALEKVLPYHEKITKGLFDYIDKLDPEIAASKSARELLRTGAQEIGLGDNMLQAQPLASTAWDLLSSRNPLTEQDYEITYALAQVYLVQDYVRLAIDDALAIFSDSQTYEPGRAEIMLELLTDRLNELWQRELFIAYMYKDILEKIEAKLDS